MAILQIAKSGSRCRRCHPPHKTVLGKLFKAIAQNRVQPCVAANLVFVAKLLLQSLDDLKDEYRFKYNYEAWKAMQQDAINLSDPPVPIPPGTKPLPASAGALAAELLAPDVVVPVEPPK